jgi:hypothetical protein
VLLGISLENTGYFRGFDGLVHTIAIYIILYGSFITNIFLFIRMKYSMLAFINSVPILAFLLIFVSRIKGESDSGDNTMILSVIIIATFLLNLVVTFHLLRKYFYVREES